MTILSIHMGHIEIKVKGTFNNRLTTLQAVPDTCQALDLMPGRQELARFPWSQGRMIRNND